MDKYKFAQTAGYLYYTTCEDLLNAKYSGYVLNETNAEKLKKIEKYCKQLTKKTGGKIDGYYIEKEFPSAIEVRFSDDLTFGYMEDDIPQLTKILSLCDGVTISNAGNDEDFLIAFFVKDLFIPKK